MRIFSILAVLGATTLVGCTAMYGTPASRQQSVANMADYTLCEKLGVARLAPSEIRNEWAMELQRRGVDCGRYASMVNGVAERTQSQINTGLQSLQRRPSSGAGGGASGVTCFKEREWTSGMNKNCVYSCVGSEAVQTMRAADICPITIVR